VGVVNREGTALEEISPLDGGGAPGDLLPGGRLHQLKGPGSGKAVGNGRIGAE